MRVECKHCGKRFSGEEEKLNSVRACPKCGAGAAWWKNLESMSVPVLNANPMNLTQKRAIPPSVSPSKAPIKHPRPTVGETPRFGRLKGAESSAQTPATTRKTRAWVLIVASAIVLTGSVLGILLVTRGASIESIRMRTLKVSEKIRQEECFDAAELAFKHDRLNTAYYTYVLENDGLPPPDEVLLSWDKNYDPLGMLDYLANAKVGESRPLKTTVEEEAKAEVTIVWLHELISILNDPAEFERLFSPFSNGYAELEERLVREHTPEHEIEVRLAFYVFERIGSDDLFEKAKQRLNSRDRK